MVMFTNLTVARKRIFSTVEINCKTKGIRPVKAGCWYIGGDDLTWACNTIHNGDILEQITQVVLDNSVK